MTAGADVLWDGRTSAFAAKMDIRHASPMHHPTSVRAPGRKNPPSTQLGESNHTFETKCTVAISSIFFGLKSHYYYYYYYYYYFFFLCLLDFFIFGGPFNRPGAFLFSLGAIVSSFV
jgi:hypothetical protein